MAILRILLFGRCQPFFSVSVSFSTIRVPDVTQPRGVGAANQLADSETKEKTDEICCTSMKQYNIVD